MTTPSTGRPLPAANVPFRERVRHVLQAAAWLPWAIAFVGTLLSVLAALSMHAEVVAKAQTRFDSAADRIEAELTQRLRQPLHGLGGARGVYAASAQVTREEFRAYAESLGLDQQFPGVRGVGVIERVPRARLDEFLARTRADGAPGFAIRTLTPGESADLWPIKYIEPLARNAPALGLDVGSEPLRRTAIERAVDSGEPTLTAPIVLVQDGQRSPGFLLYLPIYRPGAATATPEQRREALMAVAYAPLVAAELFAGAGEAASGLVDFRLEQAAAGPAPGQMVYDSLAPLPASATTVAGPAATTPRYRAERRTEIFGAVFELRLASNPALDAAVETRAPWLALAAGLLLTGFLGSLARSTAVARTRAEALAQRMTAELDRLAAVARHTSNAVIITNLQRRITWVNEGFTRISGYSADEALGRSPGELLQCPGTDRAEVARLRAALDATQPFSGRLLNRAKDGSEYWLDIEIQPVRDAQGRHIAFMAIETDITERLRAEAALSQATRDNEALLGTIGTHTIVSVAAPDGTIIDANDAFCDISGYTRGELVGQNHRIVNSGHHPRAFWAAMWSTVTAGRPWRGQVCNRAKDGSLYWVDSIIAPFVGADGRIDKLVSLRTDITASKQAAQELEWQRWRLQQIVEGTGAGTWEHNFRTDEDLINERYASMLGYGVEELRTRMRGQFLELVHPEDAARAAQATADHLEQRTESYLCEFRMRHRDGHWVWIQSHGRVSGRDANGQALTIAGIHLDISQRRESEREMARQKLRLQNILEGTDVGTWEWNVESGESIFNDRWAEICGYTIEELSPISIETWSRLCHPEDLARSTALLQRHFAGELQVYECEVRMRHKQGHWVWVLDRGKLFSRTEDGRPRWMAGTHMEITERKEAEAALQSATERLQLAVDSGGIGVFELEIGTQAVTWDAWMHRHYGSQPGDDPTGVFLARVHPEDKAAVLQRWQQAMQGQLAMAHEFRIVWPDGQLRHLRAAGSVARDAEGQARRIVGVTFDVTEQRRQEQALLEKQAFLDSAGRIAGVGSWAVDIARSEVYWSDQTCRIHDLAPGHRPTLAEAINYYEPSARATIEQAVRAATEGGGGWDLELPLITARGRNIWVRAVGEVQRDTTGQPARLVGAFQDITERRRLEAELRQRNEVMASILENLPCGLSVFDGDLNLVVSNTKFRELRGFPDDLFERSPLSFETLIRFNAERGEYGAGDVDAIARTAVERARWAAVAPHRFEHQRPNGATIEIQGAPMPGGGFVTTYTDVSERKRAEADARSSAALLRGAIDAVDEAFVLYDPQDRLVFCNDKYRDVYRSSADLIVEGATFESIVRAGAERGQYQQAVGQVDEWVAQRVAAHRAGNVTMLQTLDDGRVIRVIERRMPDGHIVGFRIDVTDLMRATEAAEEASRSKSRFLANMSHEIRTPMNAILGMLTLLRRTELTPRQSDYATKTEGAARSLLGLLNDILDFSKVEAGKMTLDLHPFRVDQLLRDLSVILSATAGGKPLEVLFDTDPALPKLLVGDPLRLQQVLINLAGNAIKFTPQGEVVVAVMVAARDDEAVTLHFEVRDTGIGIAPEHQQVIFSGFTQAESSTTRRFGGTGLGLAISQRLVAMMGGELRLDSTLDVGSRFHFQLRLALPPAQAADGDRAATQPSRPVGLRVLVVDDSAAAREVLARMVGSLGWQADVVDGGERALELLAASPAAYDAVFIDWHMPGLDGWQTCERIRSQQLLTHEPVVVMVTAHDREALAQRGAEEQRLIDGFLVKPVTASMLHDAILDAQAARGDATRPAVRVRGDTGATRRLVGLRLLVVEDNPNNQQVARELLEAEGAEVSIATNGAEGVEAVAAASPEFNVVLMDLQMPVMDGYTATRRIREDLGRATLPIVAMTANTMASDREACLAAGMDDHIGKPFDLDGLVGVLRRLAGWSQAEEGGGRDSGSDPGVPADAAAAATAAGVDLAAALRRLGGARAVYTRLLGDFVADLAPFTTRLQAHLSAHEFTEARRALHTFKGLAATLGATALARWAGDAETRVSGAGVEADMAWTETGGTVRDAAPALGRLLALLEHDDDRTDAGAGAQQHPAAATEEAAARYGTDGDNQPLAGSLQTLERLLADADLDALALMERLRHGPAGNDVRLRALEDAVIRLDFDAARVQCQSLLEALQERPA